MAAVMWAPARHVPCVAAPALLRQKALRWHTTGPLALTLAAQARWLALRRPCRVRRFGVDDLPQQVAAGLSKACTSVESKRLVRSSLSVSG